MRAYVIQKDKKYLERQTDKFGALANASLYSNKKKARDESKPEQSEKVVPVVVFLDPRD